MIHSFNTDLAEKFGIEKAILLDHICYWIAENERNEVNFIDGKTWVFNTAKALNEKFHYMSQRSLARYLDELERDGVLIVGNYCKNHFNRTKWYALSDKYMPLLNDYKSMSEIKNSQNNENIDIAKNEQSSCQNGNIIPTKNGKSSCQNGNSDDAKMSIQNCQNGKSEKYTNLYAKENLQIPKEKIKKEKSLLLFDLPSFIDKNIFQDFINHRKEIKKPLTQTALKALIANLEKIHAKGLNANEALLNSIANGWQGVFEPKGEQKYQSIAERESQARQEQFARLRAKYREIEANEAKKTEIIEVETQIVGG